MDARSGRVNWTWWVVLFTFVAASMVLFPHDGHLGAALNPVARRLASVQDCPRPGQRLVADRRPPRGRAGQHRGSAALTPPRASRQARWRRDRRRSGPAGGRDRPAGCRRRAPRARRGSVRSSRFRLARTKASTSSAVRSTRACATASPSSAAANTAGASRARSEYSRSPKCSSSATVSADAPSSRSSAAVSSGVRTAPVELARCVEQRLGAEALPAAPVTGDRTEREEACAGTVRPDARQRSSPFRRPQRRRRARSVPARRRANRSLSTSRPAAGPRQVGDGVAVGGDLALEVEAGEVQPRAHHRSAPSAASRTSRSTMATESPRPR